MVDPTAAQGTLMHQEAAEAAEVIRRQQQDNAAIVAALGERLRAQPPRAVATLGRGSSDNAATYARYLIETHVGILTSSAAPSIASVYEAAPDMRGVMMLVISQSGRSPDLIAAAEAAKGSGALIVALVNAEDSPLAAMADVLVPLRAGPERSVAATKSFIATLGAVLHILAEWTGKAAVRTALASLPDRLAESWALDWSGALPVLAEARNLYVVGRGPGYGIAQEMALKIKETCGFHAEAFSAAEVRHGPMTLVGAGFPVLMIGQEDDSLDSVAALAQEFAGRGAALLTAGVPGAGGTELPALSADPLVQPILLVESFYRMVNALSVLRGHDPDHPPHLAKVTETV